VFFEHTQKYCILYQRRSSGGLCYMHQVCTIHKHTVVNKNVKYEYFIEYIFFVTLDSFAYLGWSFTGHLIPYEKRVVRTLLKLEGNVKCVKLRKKKRRTGLYVDHSCMKSCDVESCAHCLGHCRLSQLAAFQGDRSSWSTPRTFHCSQSWWTEMLDNVRKYLSFTFLLVEHSSNILSS
jgi:hypothetical protein